jgi:hypothetical protein
VTGFAFRRRQCEDYFSGKVNCYNNACHLSALPRRKCNLSGDKLPYVGARISGVGHKVIAFMERAPLWEGSDVTVTPTVSCYGRQSCALPVAPLASESPVARHRGQTYCYVL